MVILGLLVDDIKRKAFYYKIPKASENVLHHYSLEEYSLLNWNLF